MQSGTSHLVLESSALRGPGHPDTQAGSAPGGSTGSSSPTSGCPVHGGRVCPSNRSKQSSGPDSHWPRLGHVPILEPAAWLIGPNGLAVHHNPAQTTWTENGRTVSPRRIEVLLWGQRERILGGQSHGWPARALYADPEGSWEKGREPRRWKFSRTIQMQRSQRRILSLEQEVQTVPHFRRRHPNGHHLIQPLLSRMKKPRTEEETVSQR